MRYLLDLLAIVFAWYLLAGAVAFGIGWAIRHFPPGE